MISDASTHHPEIDRESNLYEYFAVILRRKEMFGITAAVVFTGIALFAFLMKPVYEASSTLYVQGEKTKATMLGDLPLSTANPVSAELEILKSRTNAEQVVTRLHLDWKIEEKSNGLVFKVLEFSSTAKTPVYWIKLTGADTFTVRDKNGNMVGDGKSGAIMVGKGVTFLLSGLQGREGDGFKITLLPFNATVRGLRGGIKAKEVGRQTRVIQISYASTDPVLARDVVNALVQAYLEQSVAYKSEEASRTVAFLGEQLQGLRKDLDNSEINLQDYKSKTGVVKLDSEAEELIKKISETERNLAAVTLQRKQGEYALDALNEAMRKGYVYSPSVMRDDPLVAGLAARLSDLEIQKKGLMADYTDEYPAVKTLQEQIAEVQRKIRSTYETAIINFKKQQEIIRQNLASYEESLRSLPGTERELAKLTRISKVSADIYTFLLQKNEEARIAKGSTISNINIIDPAITPDVPVKPKRMQYIIFGLLVGLVLGTGLAFLQESLDNTIKEGEMAGRILGLPILAVVPHMRRTKNGDADKVSLITHLEPRSSVAETFRALRTNLHFSNVGREKKFTLITSTFPDEGKTTIASNMAITFSQTGARVLVVDCDMRRSSLHEKFGLNKSPGLSDLLTGDVTIDEIRHETSVQGCTLIAAGTHPPNPAELLGSENMRSFLASQRDLYDHIIIDAPPIMAVTDAPVLTAVVDAVVMIMENGRVPIRAAQHVRELLATYKAPVAGLVINDKTGKGKSYYGGRYRGYYRNKKYYGYRGDYGSGYGYGYGYGIGYGYYSDEETRTKAPLPPWRRYINRLSLEVRKRIKRLKQ